MPDVSCSCNGRNKWCDKCSGKGYYDPEVHIRLTEAKKKPGYKKVETQSNEDYAIRTIPSIKLVLKINNERDQSIEYSVGACKDELKRRGESLSTLNSFLEDFKSSNKNEVPSVDSIKKWKSQRIKVKTILKKYKINLEYLEQKLKIINPDYKGTLTKNKYLTKTAFDRIVEFIEQDSEVLKKRDAEKEEEASIIYASELLKELKLPGYKELKELVDMYRIIPHSNSKKDGTMYPDTKFWRDDFKVLLSDINSYKFGGIKVKTIKKRLGLSMRIVKYLIEEKYKFEILAGGSKLGKVLQNSVISVKDFKVMEELKNSNEFNKSELSKSASLWRLKLKNKTFNNKPSGGS